MMRIFPTTRTAGLAVAALALAAALPARGDCIDDAATEYSVNPYVLRAIGWQESRLNPAAMNRNLNGTIDIGAFQINSRHLATLRASGISAATLRDGCVSAYVAAWHYRQQIEHYGNTWLAVGAYHSRTPALNASYSNRIAATLMGWHLLPLGPLPFATPLPLAYPRASARALPGAMRSPARRTSAADPIAHGEPESSVVFDAPETLLSPSH